MKLFWCEDAEAYLELSSMWNFNSSKVEYKIPIFDRHVNRYWITNLRYIVQNLLTLA